MKSMLRQLLTCRCATKASLRSLSLLLPGLMGLSTLAMAQTQPATMQSVPPASSSVVGIGASSNNVFPQGQFELLDRQGMPVGWTITTLPGNSESESATAGSNNLDFVKVEEERGDHFITLQRSAATNNHAVKTISSSLPLDGNWRFLQITAKLRLINLNLTDQLDPDAKLLLSWEDSRHVIFGPPTTLTLRNNSDWVTLITPILEIPADAAFLRITPSFTANTGRFSVNDIRIVPNPEFPVLPPGFPQGTFEVLGTNRKPLGWDVPDRNMHEVLLEEGGNHFLRLVGTNSKDIVRHPVIYKLDPRWKRLTISARLRTLKLQPEANNPMPVGIDVSFLRKDRKVVDTPTRLRPSKINGDWEQVSAQVDVPASAVYLNIAPTLTQARGILDVDDIHIDNTPSNTAP